MTPRGVPAPDGSTGRKKTQPPRDAKDLQGGRMDDMLNPNDMKQISDWIGLKNYCSPAEQTRRGKFHEEIRKTMNFQQWKAVLRRKMQVSDADLSAYHTRVEIFSDLMDASPFALAPPFQ